MNRSTRRNAIRKLALAASIAAANALVSTDAAHGVPFYYKTSGASLWNAWSNGSYVNWNPSATLPGAGDQAWFPSMMSGGSYLPINPMLGSSQSVADLIIDTHGVFNLSGAPDTTLSITGHLYDYTEHTDTPAIHLITAPNVYLAPASNITVGGNAQLTITGAVRGSINKQGPGTLTLSNPANQLTSVDVIGGALAISGDALPFTTWDKTVELHSDAVLQVTSNSHIGRPIHGANGSGEARIEAPAGVTAEIDHGYWGFIPLTLSGGGNIHLSNVEPINIQGNIRPLYINVSASTTLTADHINNHAHAPIYLNGGSTFAAGGLVDVGSSIELRGANGTTNTIDTRGYNITADAVVTTLANQTLNKNGDGAFITSSFSSLATLNVNRGTALGLLGNVQSLNLANGTKWIGPGSETSAAAVKFTGSSTIAIGSGMVTLNGPGLTGGNQLNTWGPGTLKLANSTSSGFNGKLVVQSGQLELASAGLPLLSALSVQNSGFAIISAPNQFSPYIVPDVVGTVEFNTPSLGAAPAFPSYAFTLYDGGTLYAKQSIDLGVNRVINLNGGGAVNLGADLGKSLSIPGHLDGSGNVHKVGTGDVILGGANVYEGDTFVDDGRLILAHPRDAAGFGTLRAGSIVHVASNATLTLGRASGDNNVLGTAENPETLPSIELNGLLDTARFTTHNLGTLKLNGGVLLGTSQPASGFYDYTLNRTVTVDTAFGGSDILAPGGVGLRNAITFDVNRSADFPSRALTVSATLNNEPGDVGAVVKSGRGTMKLTANNSYSGGTIVEDGTLSIGNAARIGTGWLAVMGSDAVAAYETGRTSAAVLPGVYLESGGSVDLTDNNLIVRGGGSGTPATEVINYVRNGYNFGGHDGTNGIFASAARNDAQQNKTLGAMTGDEYANNNGSPLFDGVAYGSTDTLIKYTYFGDVDFNGSIDASDYNLIDFGFVNHLSGWANGDADYSGDVDVSDYNLIDFAFATQNGVLARAVRYLDGSDRNTSDMNDPALRQVVQHFSEFGVPYAQGFLATVPEPTTLGAVIVAAAAMQCSRGRRRR